MLIAHISDPHVTTEGTFIRSVVDTPGRLIAAFETLRDLPRAPDVIVITGDLVNDATPAEYELLVECLGHAPAPIVAIPGNHDHPRLLRTALFFEPDNTHFRSALDHIESQVPRS